MGGAERHLANLLEPLAELGVENHLATLWSGSAYEPSVRPFARWHDFGLQDRRAMPALPGLVKLALHVDVVHTQLPWADIVGRMAAVTVRKPSVTTLQTTWYDARNLHQFTPTVRRNVKAVRTLDALTARTTRRFFAVSNATRDTYVRELGLRPETVEVIPNTVDLRKFDLEVVGPRERARAELGCTPDEFVILMAARLVKAKGHGDAIIATAQLARERKVKLCIAGEGPDEQQFRQLARALCAPVELLGPRDDIPRLMCAADLFLFPAVIEGLPLVVIEAMAMGLPSLCYDIPENREAGGDCVAYTPSGDVPQLIDSLRALIADEERRRRMSGSGRERAGQFSSRFVAERLLRSIEHVLRGDGGNVVAS